jgi:flavodoxin
MQVFVVYFTKFGHTQRLAEIIGAVLAASGHVRVIAVDELDAAALAGADLVVMGSPTHKMNLPQAVRPRLDALPRKALKDVPYAAFDTSYELSWWLRPFTAGKRLSRKLGRLGGVRLLPPETFIVEGREGPLRQGETERAVVWAQSLLQAAGITPATAVSAA